MHIESISFKNAKADSLKDFFLIELENSINLINKMGNDEDGNFKDKIDSLIIERLQKIKLNVNELKEISQKDIVEFFLKLAFDGNEVHTVKHANNENLKKIYGACQGFISTSLGNAKEKYEENISIKDL